MPWHLQQTCQRAYRCSTQHGDWSGEIGEPYPEKGYSTPYEADGRTITKCGVTISSEARNIVHWRAVDNDGKVIDEQKF